jgi:hypothetical protein
MVSLLQSRSALNLVASTAVATSLQLLRSTSGSPEQRRYDLLGGVPEVIGYYQDGTGALAADFYEDQRAAANVAGSFTAEVVLLDRTVKIRRAIAWALILCSPGMTRCLRRGLLRLCSSRRRVRSGTR